MVPSLRSPTNSVPGNGVAIHLTLFSQSGRCGPGGEQRSGSAEVNDGRHGHPRIASIVGSPAPRNRDRAALAIVMIGGLVTSTLFTLLVLPTFYFQVHGWLERRSHDPGEATA
jgi:hypothetical protein